MKIKIRPSVPDDVFGIRQVTHITWLDTYPNDQAGITLDDINQKFENDHTPEGKQKIEANKHKYYNSNFFTSVVEADDNIVGFCVAGTEGDNGRILAIYLLPQYQRQGLGSKLLKKALDYLKNTNSIFINAVEYNHKAISFYKKHGFIETDKTGVIDTAATLPSGKIIPEIELVKIKGGKLQHPVY